jgi:CRISPR-associated DxTHG motif protein
VEAVRLHRRSGAGGTELIVDITHGLRSLPVLMLAACQYLRATKGVTVRHIFYGAYELRDKETNVTPVFDLQPFLELMTWSSSTEQLWRYGNAGPLAEQLKALQDRSHREGWEHGARGLKGLGEKFAHLNRALSLVRPEEVLKEASKVPKNLELARQDAAVLPEAKPLELLFERMADKVAAFAVPSGEIFSVEGFAAQAEMIRHYLETQQYQQAVTLAREALVSWVCVKERLVDRKAGEDWLNGKAKARRDRKPLDSKQDKLASIWQKLNDLRNDINHAGMRDNPEPADTAVQNVERYCAEVMAHLKA